MPAFAGALLMRRRRRRLRSRLPAILGGLTLAAIGVYLGRRVLAGGGDATAQPSPPPPVARRDDPLSRIEADIVASERRD